MSIATKRLPNFTYTITPADDGLLLEYGPGGTAAQPGAIMLQFNPGVGFVGQLTIMGRLYGDAMDQKDCPFVPIPYRLINLNNVASDYRIVSDAITTSALIQVPSNCIGVAVLVACAAGSLQSFRWDVQGSGAI